MADMQTNSPQIDHSRLDVLARIAARERADLSRLTHEHQGLITELTKARAVLKRLEAKPDGATDKRERNCLSKQVDKLTGKISDVYADMERARDRVAQAGGLRRRCEQFALEAGAA